MGEQEPSAPCWGQPCLLSTEPSQLLLRASVQAVEDLGARASVPKDFPGDSWIPQLLERLGDQLTLQGQEGCIPMLRVPEVSLAKGRGKGTLLLFLLLEALSPGFCFMFWECFNGPIPLHAGPFAV